MSGGRIDRSGRRDLPGAIVKSNIQLLCVWAGPLFLVLFLSAFWGVAGYLPPHSPSLSAGEVAALYAQHSSQIRAGQILCLIFATLLLPWFAIISVQIARIEGRFPVLALIQFGGGVLLVVFFQICSMLWIAATYRPELDANILRAMHDTSWLIFVMVFPAYTLQLICIALAGFMDKRAVPWLPRWASYLNLWVAISGGGGGVAVFFKSGPFAWNGLIGFWIPVCMFAVWLVVMAPLLAAAVSREARAEELAGA
jgi:hypothetical protein